MSKQSNFIGFELEYTPRIAGGPPGEAGSENYPLQIEVFGTHELSAAPRRRGDVWVENLDELEKKTHTISIGLTVQKRTPTFLPYYQGGAYTLPEDLVKEDRETLANSTAVIVRAYATTYSETGQACLTTIGEAAFLVRDLLEEKNMAVVLMQNHDGSSSFIARRPLNKGTVRIKDVYSRLPPLRKANKFDVDNELQAVQPKLSAMIERNLACFFGQHAFLPRPTKRALQPFHCPAFTTARATAIVSQAYTQLRPNADPDITFYEQIVRIGKRRTFGPEDSDGDSDAYLLCLGETVLENRAEPSEVAAYGAFVARSVTVFATSQVYVSDFVNRNRANEGQYDPGLIEPDEDFKVTRRLGGDDCEGVALECHMIVRQLQLASDAAVRQMSPLLQQVRQFLLLYVSCMTLGCVTNKKMTTDRLDQSNALAHTFCTLMPLQTLYKTADAKLKRQFDKSDTFRQRAKRLEQAPANLPILICEGTALIDPAMRAVSDYYGDAEREAEAAALDAMAARRAFFNTVVESGVQNVNVEIFQPPNQLVRNKPLSQFYKYPTSFSTADFTDIGVNDFALVDHDSRTYGVSFETFVAGEFDVMSTLVVSSEEAKLLDAVLLDEPPVPQLELPPELQQLDLRPKKQYVDCIEPGDKKPRGPHTMLHGRQLVISVRERDMNETVLLKLRDLARNSAVADVKVSIYNLNKQVDETRDRVNTIFDFYFLLK